MKKGIGILFFVLALAFTPLIVLNNPVLADTLGDLRRALGITRGFNASSQVVPNFQNGYQVAGSNVTATEAAYLDGLTAGTATASKAVVLDASKDYAGVRNWTLGTNGAGGAAGGLTIRNGANPGANSFAIAGATGIATLAGGATIDNNTSATVLNITETTVKVTGALNTTGSATVDTEVISPAIQGVDGSASVGGTLSIEGGAGDGAGNAGGPVDLDGGAGVAHTTGTGGAGGAVTSTGGAGGTATGAAGIGGAGGDQTVAGGAGGASSDAAAGNGGDGGDSELAGGVGGATTVGVGGEGGGADLSGGDGGAATTGDGGAGGSLDIEAGGGGATSGAGGDGGDGGDVEIAAGDGGADSEGGSGTGGDGGDIVLTPGAAGAGATPGAAGVINLDGAWQISGTTVLPTAAELNKIDPVSANGGIAFVERVTFTETAGSGTYTATVVLPANSVLLGIVDEGHVNWTADTSAAISVGYTANLTAYANAVDVKAGAPLAGAEPAGHGDYFSAGTTLTFSCAAVDATSAGGNGRDNFVVHYAIVTSVAASKS